MICHALGRGIAPHTRLTIGAFSRRRLKLNTLRLQDESSARLFSPSTCESYSTHTHDLARPGHTGSPAETSKQCEVLRSTITPQQIVIDSVEVAYIVVVTVARPILAPQEVSIKHIKTDSIMTSLGGGNNGMLLAGFDSEEEEEEEDWPKSHSRSVSR